MSREQIEEMAHCLCGQENGCAECHSDYRCEFFIECSILHKAGYRKQREGHWIRWGQDSSKCSLCDKENTNCGWNYYCPYCGARMKGGAE